MNDAGTLNENLFGAIKFYEICRWHVHGPKAQIAETIKSVMLPKIKELSD